MDARARNLSQHASLLDRYREVPRHPRSYTDLHEHVLALARAGSARRRRRADQQRYRDASAGALAVSRRHCRAATQGIPVHAADGYQGPALRHCGAGGGACCQTAMSTASASGKPLEEIGDAWVKAIAEPDCAAHRQRCPLPGRRDHRQRPRPRGRSARRLAGADLDAGLGQRALSLGRPLHHQGSRYRHAERRELSRADQGAAPAGNEPIGRVARRHLCPLGKMQGARRAAALRGRGRLSAGDLLCIGAEDAREPRRDRGCGRARGRAHQCGARRRPSIFWCRRRPRSSSRA